MASRLHINPALLFAKPLVLAERCFIFVEGQMEDRSVLSSRSSPVVLNLWTTAFKSGGPKLGIVMHKWATARKSGGQRTSVYFENGFAC